MRTEISEVSSDIEASYSVQFQERDTRKRRWEQIDDDFSAGWVSIRTRSIERVMRSSPEVPLSVFVVSIRTRSIERVMPKSLPQREAS